MARFIAMNGYYPKPGDRVAGMSRGRIYTGVALPHPRDPRKPFVFSTAHGWVGLWIKCDDGRRIAINEVRPA